MIEPLRRAGGRLWLAAMIVMIAAARTASAQDDDDPVEDELIELRIVEDDELFDRRFLGDLGGVKGARKTLENLLLSKIEDADRAYGLSEAQRKKLKLAGRGDIKRLFMLVEEPKRRPEPGELGPAPGRWRQVSRAQDVALFRETFLRGAFHENSLFSKTLRTTLTREQVARYETVTRWKKATPFEQWIYVMVSIEGGPMGLNPEQESRFARLLVEETVPPPGFDHLDSQAMLLLAADLPEAKLKPLFDDAQWRHLRQRLEQARKQKPR